MNNSLRSEIAQIISDSRDISALRPDDVDFMATDEILNLVASKMPEKIKVQTHGELNREGWSRYDHAIGYNQAITEVKSILKGDK